MKRETKYTHQRLETALQALYQLFIGWRRIEISEKAKVWGKIINALLGASNPAKSSMTSASGCSLPCLGRREEKCAEARLYNDTSPLFWVTWLRL